MTLATRSPLNFSPKSSRAQTLVSAALEVGQVRRGGILACRNASLESGSARSLSRRVKKGPGRRPLSAKRARFVQCRERGWSISAAAREVGASAVSAITGSGDQGLPPR